MPTPTTPEERQAALAAALKARQARHQLKADIAAGKRSVSEVLEAGKRGADDRPDDHGWRLAGHLEVGDLLLAVKGVGPQKAAKLLARAGIANDHTHLDRLSAAQREALSSVLG